MIFSNECKMSNNSICLSYQTFNYLRYPINHHLCIEFIVKDLSQKSAIALISVFRLFCSSPSKSFVSHVLALIK